MARIRLALAQINTVVGDIDGNVKKIEDSLVRARDSQADIVVFPELTITGYPPEDLLLRPSFLHANVDAVQHLINLTAGLTAVVGFADVDEDVYNAAAILHNGQWVHTYHKQYLPNYAVFDEDRYFSPGSEVPVFKIGEVTFGVSICEDIWYPAGPPEIQALQGGARLLINLSASPYHGGKGHSREQMLRTRAADNSAIVAYCNQIGGQDELVFDGGSVIVTERGEVVARAAQFIEDFLTCDVDVSAVFRWRLHDPRHRKTSSSAVTLVELDALPDRKLKKPLPQQIQIPLNKHGEVYQALVLGTRDYVRKNGFQKVVIGLSGGIDSTLVACVAADALGPENVTGVSMPSRYTSDMSNDDAAQLAANLG
ncbi:MAG: NAD+ synthase, partial [Anaerolineae bacterium]|nr:NAD+ synthase [Anaerolineae bacterium]